MPSASSANAGSSDARGLTADAVEASNAVLLRKELRDDGRSGVVGRDGTGRGEVVLRLFVEVSIVGWPIRVEWKSDQSSEVNWNVVCIAT